MSAEQIRLAIALLGAAILFGLVVGAFVAVARRRRRRAFRAGPGSPSVPAPEEPWRRFACALAAPYARSEWRSSRSSRRGLTREQTYFGFASALPSSTVATLLRRDWRVTKPMHAVERCTQAASSVLQSARELLAGEADTAAAVRAELLTAGAPPHAVDALDLDSVSRELAATGLRRSSQAPHTVYGNDPGRLRAKLAFDIARSANLVRWSAAVGHLGARQAEIFSDTLGAAACACFPGWEEYGAAYLSGLREYSRHDPKRFADAAERLLQEDEGPWRATPWPSAA